MSENTTTAIGNEVLKKSNHQEKLDLRSVLYSRAFLYMVSLSFFFCVWEIMAYNGVLGIPKIEDVMAYIYRLTFHDTLARLTIWGHMWVSLRRVLIGFFIAVAFGVPLGLFMALNRYVDAVVNPLFSLFKPMPPIAWVSLAILWFGIGETSKIFIIFMGAIIPTVINSYNGVRLVDQELYDVIKVLGGNVHQEKYYVALPASLPAIFGGIQLALSMSWTCVVAAELVSARSGLGFLIIMGMNISKTEAIIAGMVIIGLVGWILSTLVEKLEKFVCPWRPAAIGAEKL